MAYKYPYDEEEKRYTPPTLATNRSWWKLIVLNILTLGIYSIIFFIPLTFDLEKIHPSREREKMMNYLFAFILAYFTASIVLYAWMYQLASRVEDALSFRQVDYEFSTSDFWLWLVLGSLFLVGPWVYYHKLCSAMNLLCEIYNEKPQVD